MMCHLSMQLPTCRPFSLLKSRVRNCLNKCDSTASSRCSSYNAVSRWQNRGLQEEEDWRPFNRTKGSNAQNLKGAASGVLLSLLSPLPCLAEEHNGLFAIADIDGKTAGSIAAVLGPVLSLSILLMIVRIPLSWYPNLDGKKLPWVIAVAPTEPLLGPTRRAVPPVGGVDVAPIIWVAGLSFVNEILLGPQGILNLLQRKMEL